MYYTYTFYVNDDYGICDTHKMNEKKNTIRLVHIKIPEVR